MTSNHRSACACRLVCGPDGAGPAVAFVWDGVYTKEQADKGQALYKQHCGTCHGDALEGIEMAPALTGGDSR